MSDKETLLPTRFDQITGFDEIIRFDQMEKLKSCRAPHLHFNWFWLSTFLG